jgi:Calcineurin-like phosphoesterase
MRAVWQALGIGVLNTAFLLGGAAHHQADAQTLFQWVQVGPEGTAVVRAITDNACPKVRFDSGKIATIVRSEINQKLGGVVPAPFPVRVCEVPVPAGSIAGTLEEKVLPIARPNPQRIVVIGDTGCRLKAGEPIQDCNNPKSWPFSHIAAAAAAARPDLVIHVGDYAYRESLCPEGEAKCVGSPEPYGWEAWKADFFKPAKPLLEAAPWIMVRGNHELCQRAGNGWFRFLDISETGSADISGFELPCLDSTSAYIAKLGAFGVMVVDGASASRPDGKLDELADVVRRQLADLR